MIGGTDILIPAIGNPAALDACIRIVTQFWPQARFEDVITGKKYTNFSDLPIGRMRELFIYPNVVAEAAWDADNPDAAPNTMMYLIRSPRLITVVVDDPTTPEMSGILESIRRVLQMDLLNTGARLALAEAA